ncbi:MAG: molybdopterin-synthase adenylyltransferase MoeB [Steroidobacteraceae bacterium]
MAADREAVPEIEVDELARRLGGADPPLLLDVREPDEHAGGVLQGALLVPLATLRDAARELVGDARGSMVAYCAAGARSAQAVRVLRELGHSKVCSLRGGFDEWRRRGQHWVLPEAGEPGAALPPAQLERYARHLRLPEVGAAGQRRLLAAKVLCIGAGGLGSPASLYLAAAGVGTLGIVDDDRVELGNLQRQILHTSARVGSPKVHSAAQTLAALNPDTVVHCIESRLTAANAGELIAGYDLIIDGSDNIATRYVVNDAALRVGRPVVHGAVLAFEGQVSVFAGRPCYRCLFPEPPPRELAPSCAEAGVLGVLPGVIGTLQATEAIKWILGIGAGLHGRLLTFDALALRFTELRIAADPHCPACGAGPAPARSARAPQGAAGAT